MIPLFRSADTSRQQPQDCSDITAVSGGGVTTSPPLSACHHQLSKDSGSNELPVVVVAPLLSALAVGTPAADGNATTTNVPMMSNTSCSKPQLARTSSDRSSQSLPASPQKRRVIFPTLHHRSSWPDEALSSPPPPDANLPSIPRPVVAVTPAKPEDIFGAPLPTPPSSGNTAKACLSSRGLLQGQHLTLPPQKKQNTSAAATTGPAPLPSILRTGHFCRKEASHQQPPPTKMIVVDKIPSVESDIPSLASTVSQSSLEDLAQQQNARGILPAMVKPDKVARAVTVPVTQADHHQKAISFDPRVWVREFHRTPAEEATTWYSSEDLEGFKSEAVQLILKATETELFPTGTGRFVSRKVLPKSKAFFSHRALRLEAAEDDEDATPSGSSAKASTRQQTQEQEIRKILLVDPHDICVKLFAKGFKNIFPHAEVVGALSSAEALQKCKSDCYDIVLVEERLKLFHHQQSLKSGEPPSGTALIELLKKQNPKALYIGVSSRWKEDAPKLKAAGANVCWPKPPPKLDDSAANDLLRTLLQLRGRSDLLQSFSSGTTA